MVYIPEESADPSSRKGYDGTNKQALLAAVRAAVETAGGRSITMRKFLAHSGLARRDIFKHYDGWNELTTAAGFDFDPRNRKLDETRLLADWGAAARKLKRIPTRKQYTQLGSYHPCTLENRFGSWTVMPTTFHKFAARIPAWKDVLKLIASSGSPASQQTRLGGHSNATPPPPFSNLTPHSHRRRRCTGVLTERKRDRPFLGEQLHFGPLRHTPTNEQGVVFLFGVMAERLGFLVEGFQIKFPDCEAKRRIGPGWQTVKIEFEYESKNFQDHAHDPNGCDLIVCWENNWPECPVEVLPLNEEIKRLSEI